MGNLVFGSAERPGNPIDAAEIPVVRDNDGAIGQGTRPTERPEKNTQTARHNGAQRGADAESAIKRDGGGNLPKQDSQPNILVPETPDRASRLPKPLFSVVEETPEMTSLFASPDSAFESRPVDPDDTEWKTPATTEKSIDGNKRRAENDGPCRKSQSNDRTHGRSKSYSTPKGPRKRIHWAEIEDVLAPSKIDGSSSDTCR